MNISIDHMVKIDPNKITNKKRKVKPPEETPKSGDDGKKPPEPSSSRVDKYA